MAILKTRALIGVVGISIAGLLTGCADESVLKLKVGDCISRDVLNTVGVSQAQVLKCSTPHDAEIFASHTWPDGKYPGDTKMTLESSKICRKIYRDFSGIDFSQSQLKLSSLQPTIASWQDNHDRTTLCVVYSLSEKFTSSLKNQKR